jgi:hypothetical protein
MLHLEYSFIWCWNLDASNSRSETHETSNSILKKGVESKNIFPKGAECAFAE